MTIDEIKTKRAQDSVKFDLAEKIRALLDKARESWEGETDFDEIENEVNELVFGE